MSDVFSALAQIAEGKIRQAIENGELDKLPGAGRPLTLEDLSDVPEDLRMAYKLLKNAGCLPPEIQDRKECASLLTLLENCHDERERVLAMRKLRLIVDRMSRNAERHCSLTANDEYYQKILSRLEKYERNTKTE